MDCDPIAGCYRFFEYAAFGKRLERHRLHFLSRTGFARHALVLGDGDGRFLAQLASANRDVQIDSVEISPRMTALARRNFQQSAESDAERVTFLIADARVTALPRCQYDLIVTHFFLDCFDTGDVAALVGKVAEHTAPGALWIVSEFCLPPDGWRRRHAALWLRAMYAFFRWTAGLETNRLPEYRSILAAHGFVLLKQHKTMAQMVCSEVWRNS